MANEYYGRLSEMNPGELADGLAIEAELDAISQGFSKLPTPHAGGQGFDGPVRVGDAVNTDEAVSLGQLNAAIGEAVLLDIAIYGNLNAAEWSALPSNNYVLYGTGAQFSNTPYALVAGAVYTLSVRHVIGAQGVNLYHDTLSLFSISDPTNVDLRRLFVRTGSSLSNANSGGWFGLALKKPALTALESLTPAADQMAYYTAGAAAMTALTALARTLLAASTTAAARSALDAYGKNNIVGTVGQSSGTPTGAIIERGSNANGEYTKYADGTMQCSYWNYSARTISNAAGSLFVEAAYSTWTFPAAFSARPNILTAASRDSIDGYLPLIQIQRPGLASVLYRFGCTINNPGNVMGVELLAVGRWYQ